MRKLKLLAASFISLTSLGFAQLSTALETSAEVHLQARYFPQEKATSDQEKTYPSVAVETEAFHDWDDGKQRVAGKFFVRKDIDDKRTHADVRELYWRKSFPNQDIDVSIGAKKVFWGVTESNHLIDIINQTDIVEDLDREDKLGQPMLQAVIDKNWGTTELYVMPYFRKQRFPGNKSRFRSPVPIKTSEAEFESSKKEKHVDYAARWSHVVGDGDIGISYFQGTDRNPELLLKAVSPTVFYLVPKYNQLKQTAVDFQYATGDLLLKLEALHRENQNGSSEAAVSGLEYTLVGVFETATDLGLIVEYQYDNEKTSKVADNDLVLGTRLALNDAPDTNILALVSIDDTNNSKFYGLEASRRLGDLWKASLNARIFSDVDEKDPSFIFKNSDYVELEFTRFISD